MKFAAFVLVFVFAKEICAAAPAFSTPLYSNSYLPATLQVIFHATEQLRFLQIEETAENATTLHSPAASSIKSGNNVAEKTVQVTPETNAETPEENQETPEQNYATPETNYEMAENSGGENERVQKGKKNASVVSVIDEVYSLVNPALKQSSTEIKFEMDATEKSENLEEDELETKFTMLGEKVRQVPRPSLSSFLKRSKVPVKSSLQQLALLYDSLNRDARKQGYSKYAGYSDQVLKALETSAGGGAGEQIKTLLEKTVQRNELTRDEAKAKATEFLSKLGDPASEISRDLRRTLPLRYVS